MKLEATSAGAMGSGGGLRTNRSPEVTGQRVGLKTT